MHGVMGKPPGAATDKHDLATSRLMLLMLVAILATAFVEEGRHVVAVPSFGFERRGAPVASFLRAIQRYAESHRYSVVRDFCGHGVGRLFHDAPEVVHAAKAGTGPELRPGMFFTIEPMINLGKPHVKILSDGWTAVTRDRSLSAQFEHTVGVTETGCEVFTYSPTGLHRPPYALDL